MNNVEIYIYASSPAVCVQDMDHLYL